MKAIIEKYNSSYYPYKITWDNGRKSVVIESVNDAEKYIKAFLPIDTKIIYKGVTI